MAQAPAFLPTNRLETQLVAASSGGEQSKRILQEALLTETLYAATASDLAEGVNTIQPGQRLEVRNAKLPDGRHAMAVFSSPQRLETFFGATAHISVLGRDLMNALKGDVVVLNPGSGIWVYFEPSDIHAMLGGPIKVALGGGEVMMGAPEKSPDQMLRPLRRVLERNPDVMAAWLALAIWPEKGERWYLDIRATGDKDSLARSINKAFDGVDMAGKELDLAISGPGPREGRGLVVIAPRTAV